MKIQKKKFDELKDKLAKLKAAIPAGDIEGN